MEFAKAVMSQIVCFVPSENPMNVTFVKMDMKWINLMATDVLPRLCVLQLLAYVTFFKFSRMEYVKIVL